MKDSDPRPMPQSVLAAYEDPLDLAKLFASEVFSESDRLCVRKDLLDCLIKKHGNVEVKSLDKYRPIRSRVAQFRKDIWGSIEIITRVEEYGGEDGVLLELAKIMEPHWLRWWDSFRFEDIDPSPWINAVSCVLGPRQLLWLAAQSTRLSIDNGSSSSRDDRLEAIYLAERFALKPLPREECSEEAYRIYSVLYERVRVIDEKAFADLSASQTAIAVSDFAIGDKLGGAGACARAIFRSASSFKNSEYVDFVVRHLITPTLVTSASGGLR